MRCTKAAACLAALLLFLPAATGASTLGLEGWSGYQSAVRMTSEGQGGSPAMRWDYEIRPQSLVFAARSDLDPSQFAQGSGVRITLRSDRDGPIFLHLRERGDESTYQYQVNLGTGWQSLRIPFSDFRRDTDTPDENGRLDPDQIGEFWIVDASGYFAPQLAGPRTVWVDEVGADGGGAPSPTAAAPAPSAGAPPGGGSSDAFETLVASALTAAGLAAVLDWEDLDEKSDDEVIASGPTSASDNLKTDPAVLRDGSGYVMYYGGNRTGGGQEIYRATSQDGRTWSRQGRPVLRLGPRGSWDGGDVETPTVVKVGGVYHLYYCGRAVADDPDEWSRQTAYQIGHATSTDGVNWTKDPANPVIRLGNRGRNDWNWAAAAEPSVIYDEQQRQFRLYYVGINVLGSGAHAHIGLATSADGSSFQNHRGNPVIASDPRRATGDFNGFYTPAVVRDGTGYRIFYVTDTWNHQPSGPIRMGSSPDGLTWKLDERTLAKKGGGWKKHGVFAPSVLVDGDALHLWYTGFAYTNAPNFGIGYARYARD